MGSWQMEYTRRHKWEVTKRCLSKKTGSSSSSMSASQKKALRKVAEDLYDKCQIYGKSYGSRC
jgi:hypothetical protein